MPSHPAFTKAIKTESQNHTCDLHRWGTKPK